MRRAFFFIVVIVFATTSLASIPRVSALDATPPIADTLSETRIRVSDVLAPFERPAESELTRALHRGYGDVSRTYASGLGRFLSVDPVLDVKRHLSKPQGWNRYSYVENNPINARDPDGRAIDTVLDVAFIAYDLLDMAATKIGGGDVTTTQKAALAADVGMVFVPFGTGGGIAVRSAAHAGAGGARHLLPAIAKSTVDNVVESAGRAASPQIQAGARALEKKLGHAAAGGFESAFAGIKPTQANAEKLIQNILGNAKTVDVKGKYVDVYNAAGQGVRYRKDTNEFVTFLEGSLRK